MDDAQEGYLLRIYIGESDRWEHQPLYEAIVGEARRQGLAGATVLRASMGFGMQSRLHTAKVLALSSDLPILVEIADRKEKIEAFLDTLETMMDGGLATLEKVRVIRYRGHSRK